jgi:DNA-binding HxlR family transcriptional regulator
LEIEGTRSALRNLGEAIFGTSRCDDVAELVGLSEAVMTAGIRDLVEPGLMGRPTYRQPGQRVGQQSRLTDKVGELLPALAAPFHWGTGSGSIRL